MVPRNIVWRVAIKKISLYIVLPLLLLFLINSPCLSAPTRGIKVTGKTGESLYLYKDYHALVVGVSNYERWPKLPNAVNDAKEVASTLKELGFHVKLVLDPTSREMKTVLNEMVYQMGPEENRALLFYYAGHGETETMADKTKLGYLIPRDCPLLKKDPLGFATHAISMREIESVTMRIKSKHVLMLFDSCFSGALFALVRATPDDITEKSTLPVRQFITAGREDEQVPDKSIFKRCFLIGLEGDADLTGDGYITGSELGMYLSDKVVNYTHRRQHPQYGKINNPDLDRGDFIFALASSSAISEEPSGKEETSTLSVEANLTGARVLVDGREVGATPLTDREVSPGEHRVGVEKQGYEPYHKQVQFEPGRSMSLYVDLSPSAPRKAHLFVETEPQGATIRIMNIVPKFYQGIELEAGPYHVEVSADGYEKKSLWVVLDAGEDKNLNIVLNRLTPAQERKTFTNAVGMKFVFIPKGTFMMGSPADEPGRDNDETQHRVTLTRPFYMQATEITQGQWQSIMGTNPSYFKNCGNDCPVEKVSWEDSQDFIRRLNQKEGTNKYRLPTEAEWEYACRAGSTRAFANGGITEIDCGHDPNLDAMGWYCGNAENKTRPVAQKNPNTWGLYDMHGNVWEWCEDWYGDYPSGYVTDSKGASSGKYRVFRGGSWYNNAGHCRSASRNRSYPDNIRYNIGFRLARQAGGSDFSE